MARISSSSLLLLLLFLLCSASSASPLLQTGFCDRALAASTCPSPPTFDSLNLTSYAGSWFQIGVTGRFQLQTEPGLACVKALYTLQPADGSVAVVNSGVSVLSGPGAADVAAAGAATAAACTAARSACFTAAKEASTSAALDAAAGRLGHIQSLLIGVSQGNYTPAIAAEIEAEAAELRRHEVADLLAAARKSPDVAERKEVTRRARAIQKAARKVGKRGRSMRKRGREGMLAAEPVVVAVPGRAVQVGGGKLEVSFFGGPAAPYWVLAVEGDYEAALVYSCIDVGGGGAAATRQDKSLYILSRAASLDSATVFRLLSLASSYAISVTDCDDAFFLTRQSCAAAA